jgi:hypothetical protein
VVPYDVQIVSKSRIVAGTGNVTCTLDDKEVDSVCPYDGYCDNSNWQVRAVFRTFMKHFL